MIDTKPDLIAKNVGQLLESIPAEVTLVAAAKARSPEEIEAAVQAGITCIGQNYVQEAERVISRIGSEVRWHMIGHLQRNKVKKAMRIFDMIQTVDSWRLAMALERSGETSGKTMPVLIEINSGREPNKTGVLPEEAEDLVVKVSRLQHLRIQGLMTMGPRFGDPEEARPFFRATKEAFDILAARGIPNVSMKTLSMGMSNSYRIAIEEGANLVRIGSSIFGNRPAGQDCEWVG
ncbi:MAG: YggS family pyridoxal phosphate-dependent enzyme [Gemmatimonadota bacterium]|jgi:pyridoxal phosphate enzyme (YggS family)